MPLPTYKEIIDLIKKGFQIEAQEKIMELREAAIQRQEEKHELIQQLRDRDEKIRELEAQLTVRDGLVWEPPYYWLGDGDKRDGPFCQRCKDADGKLVRLHCWRKGAWVCKVCKAEFKDSSYEEDPPRPRRTRTPHSWMSY